MDEKSHYFLTSGGQAHRFEIQQSIDTKTYQIPCAVGF